MIIPKLLGKKWFIRVKEKRIKFNMQSVVVLNLKDMYAFCRLARAMFIIIANRLHGNNNRIKYKIILNQPPGFMFKLMVTSLICLLYGEDFLE